MASIVKNEKGFKVIKIDSHELRQAVGSPGICDNCLEMPEEGYYIAVLNSWCCPRCYHKWILMPLTTERINLLKKEIINI